MKHLVLFPTRNVHLLTTEFDHDERFPRDEYDVFYVDEDAARRLEGRRFKDVYVHWFCYDEIGFDKCVAMILQAQAFMDEPGQSFLFK